MSDANVDMSDTLGVLPEVGDMKLDLTKEEKLRTAALMLGIRYHVDTIIKDPRYLELMIQREKEAKYSPGDGSPDDWHLRPSTVIAVIHCAQEFEQYLLGNRPGMMVVSGGEEVVPHRKPAEEPAVTEKSGKGKKRK
jgi:hypothetical protein